MKHQPSKAVWYDTTVKPRCDKQNLIPVIVQRNGRVYRAWYLNEYPLVYPDDPFFDDTEMEGEYDETYGYVAATGFHDDAALLGDEECYTKIGEEEIECWAYMPEPRRVAKMGR